MGVCERKLLFFERLITNLLCAYEVLSLPKLHFAIKKIFLLFLSLIFENLKPNKIDYFSSFFMFKIFISGKKEL